MITYFIHFESYLGTTAHYADNSIWIRELGFFFFISASHELLGNLAGVKYNPQHFHFFLTTSECNHFYAFL